MMECRVFLQGVKIKSLHNFICSMEIAVVICISFPEQQALLYSRVMENKLHAAKNDVKEARDA